VTFASRASQLAALEVHTRPILWDKAVGFHVDEYLGIPDDPPEPFHHYLLEQLTAKVEMRQSAAAPHPRLCLLCGVPGVVSEPKFKEVELGQKKGRPDKIGAPRT
jgi:hypothetical protein